MKKKKEEDKFIVPLEILNSCTTVYRKEVTDPELREELIKNTGSPYCYMQDVDPYVKSLIDLDPVVVFNEDDTMRLENYFYTGVETIKGEEGDRLSALIEKEGFRYAPNHGDFRVYGTVNLNNNHRLPIALIEILQVYRMTVLYIRKYYRAISFFLENRVLR